MASLSSLPKVKPSTAWLFVFLPALTYYVSTRLHTLGLFRGSSYGETIETALLGVTNCQDVQKHLLYTNKDCTALRYPLYLVRDDFEGVVATAWKHDEELGRGYLLLSTSHQHGLIWQWETGGGPIPIGRTLSMVDSGCRSNLYKKCSDPISGSGGIIIDGLQEPPRLIVAEWGEGRISRLEENGARTPLIIKLQDETTKEGENSNIPENGIIDESQEKPEETTIDKIKVPERLHRPFSLRVTPFGDLLVLDSTKESGDFLWRLQQIHKIPGLESLSASRKAHAWNQLQGGPLPQVLLQSQTLGGMALVSNSWLQLYVTMRQGDSVVVVTLSLDDDDEDDDDDDDEVVVEGSSTTMTTERQSAILLDYTSHASAPGPIEVDDKGNLYLAVDGGILFVSSSGSVLGKLAMPDISIVDMTLGEDKFLYIATETKLFRFSLRNKLMKVPTDLIMK